MFLHHNPAKQTDRIAHAEVQHFAYFVLTDAHLVGDIVDRIVIEWQIVPLVRVNRAEEVDVELHAAGILARETTNFLIMENIDVHREIL